MSNIIGIPRAGIDAALSSGLLGHLEPVLEAVRDAGIAFVTLAPGERIADVQKAVCGRPWLCLVGDDKDASAGPGAFDAASLIRTARQATHVAVYSGAGAPHIYAGFALVASLGGRVLVIETQLRHHADWTAFMARHAPKAAFLDISPRGGTA